MKMKVFSNFFGGTENDQKMAKFAIFPDSKCSIGRQSALLESKFFSDILQMCQNLAHLDLGQYDT